MQINFPIIFILALFIAGLFFSIGYVLAKIAGNTRKEPGKKGFVLWLTGLSGAGKTTLAEALYQELKAALPSVEILDGDIVRSLFNNRGFDKESRNEHIKRMGFISGLLERNGVAVISAFISPYSEAREFARSQCHHFIEIYVATPVDECKKRDVKGLYRKAEAGEISNFTGVNDPYEEPENPEIRIDTTGRSVENCAEQVLRYLRSRSYL